MPSTPFTSQRLLRDRARQPRTWLVVLLLGLACYRFTLIDRGHFFWGDEQRYLSAVAVVDDWSAGEFRAGLAHLYECYARPGFVLASTLPVLLQRVIGGWLGIEPDTLRSYDIASGFNVVVSLAVACCLFRLARAWIGCPWYALLVVAIYSLLCNANVWIRHLMPYNQSLLLFLLALLILSTDSQRDRSGILRGLAAGCLCALGFASYPTYYLFVVINGVVLLAIARRRVWATVAFGVGSAVVVGLFELLAQLGGTSYVQELFASVAEHAGQKDQGYYPEGYVFVWRYLRDVEGPAGIVLFLLFAGFAALVLWRRQVNLPRAARVAIAAGMGCYLIHASASVLFHKTVFFGRILGMYLPLLVCGAVLALNRIRHPFMRRFGVCGLVCASVWSFGVFAWPYARITYPADLFMETMVSKVGPVPYPPAVLWGAAGGARDSIEELNAGFVTVSDALPDGSKSSIQQLASHEAARTSGARYLGVNLKWVFYYRQRDDRFVAPEGYKLVASALSPVALPATGYEAYKPWERKRLLQRRYAMSIYERIDALASKDGTDPPETLSRGN